MLHAIWSRYRDIKRRIEMEIVRDVCVCVCVGRRNRMESVRNAGGSARENRKGLKRHEEKESIKS